MGTLSKAALQVCLILICAGIGTAWTYYGSSERPALYLSPELPATHGIGLSEVLSWRKPPVWIDARPSPDYSAAHIPGAVSLDPGNVDAQMKTHFDLFIDQRNVFVIYGPEAASQAIAERLGRAGLQKVHVLEGGWEAWQAHHS